MLELRFQISTTSVNNGLRFCRMPMVISLFADPDSEVRIFRSIHCAATAHEKDSRKALLFSLGSKEEPDPTFIGQSRYLHLVPRACDGQQSLSNNLMHERLNRPLGRCSRDA